MSSVRHALVAHSQHKDVPHTANREHHFLFSYLVTADVILPASEWLLSIAKVTPDFLST